MEAFIIGIGLGCLIGVATAYLIASRPKDDEPPTWAELIDQQMHSLEQIEGNRMKPRAVTRLTNRERTVTL